MTYEGYRVGPALRSLRKKKKISVFEASEITVHVEVKPLEVTRYHLRETSMALAESIQSVHKSRIRGKIGHVDADSGVMDKLDAAVKLHLGLSETVC